MKEKYEPIKFDSWQELAKYVIDGGEVYFKAFQNKYLKVTFNGTQFDTNLDVLHKDRELFTKKQQTLEELIAIKPRLFLAWDISETEGVLKLIKDLKALRSLLNNWRNYRMLTDDEIKQFLSGEQ